MGSLFANVFKALSLSITYYAFSTAIVFIQPRVQNYMDTVEDEVDVLLGMMNHMLKGATSKPQADAKASKVTVAPPKGGNAHASREKGRVEEVVGNGAHSEWDPQDLCALCNDSLQLIGELEAMSASMGNQ